MVHTENLNSLNFITECQQGPIRCVILPSLCESNLPETWQLSYFYHKLNCFLFSLAFTHIDVHYCRYTRP